MEAARIVARAIEHIRRDEPDGLNLRRDLEPVLGRLIEEFKVELAALGVQVPDGAKPPGTFSFTPIDRALLSAGYSNHHLHRVEHLLEGEVVAAQARRVDVDLILLGAAAPRDDVGDAGDLAELTLEDPVLERL